MKDFQVPLLHTAVSRFPKRQEWAKRLTNKSLTSRLARISTEGRYVCLDGWLDEPTDNSLAAVGGQGQNFLLHLLPSPNTKLLHKLARLRDKSSSSRANTPQVCWCLWGSWCARLGRPRPRRPSRPGCYLVQERTILTILVGTLVLYLGLGLSLNVVSFIPFTPTHGRRPPRRRHIPTPPIPLPSCRGKPQTPPISYN